MGQGTEVQVQVLKVHVRMRVQVPEMVFKIVK